VLVVDDDPRVRFFTSEALRSERCTVTEAEGGAEALEILVDNDAFDILVTDVRMPRLDGWSLAERARALRPRLAVLYVTGWSDVEPRPVPHGLVLAKPFRHNDLMTHANRAIQLSA
jgi:CheY-like chemotaxis protein